VRQGRANLFVPLFIGKSGAGDAPGAARDKTNPRRFKRSYAVELFTQITPHIKPQTSVLLSKGGK